MRRSGLVVAAFAWAAGATVAAAQLRTLPAGDPDHGRLGYGTQCLSPNDDGSSNPVDVTEAFPGGMRFFHSYYTRAFVNTNGNITFNGPLPTFTPAPFPVADQPMIAPYWADVDVRPFDASCGGYPSGFGPGYLACQAPSDNGVWWHLEHGLMMVTWDRTGYYGCHGDHRMTFQLLLTRDDAMARGDFDVAFRYTQCEWEVGDASGGSGGFCGGGWTVGSGCVPAQAGFDAGDLVSYVMIPGSRTPGIAALLCASSNDGSDPGTWHFSVRDGVIICPDAGALCPAPALGVCGEGRTRCDGAGTTCDVVNRPAPETCDGRDEDCNGAVDDGAALCAADLVCDHGACMPPCPARACASGETCRAGRCVDACTDLVCAVGARCVAGTCIDECAGVSCSGELVCIHGACVDRCDGIACASGEVCRRGACIVPMPVVELDGGTPPSSTADASVSVDGSLCDGSLCFRSRWACCSVAGVAAHGERALWLVAALAFFGAVRRRRRA